LHDTTGRAVSPRPAPPAEEPRDSARRIGDIWQWLGMSGGGLGPSGTFRRTLLYSYLIAATMVGVVNTINVVTILHSEPGLRLAAPIIWEGSSWFTLLAFLWIPWIAYRFAPPAIRPRWVLLIHIPAALAFSLLHVGGFVVLRKAIYLVGGLHYDFGSFVPNFLYEFQKDSLGYLLFFGCFTLIEHLLRQQQLIATPGQTLTFDIRDGAKLTRVRLDEVLAVMSAGNYVEFVLRDRRRLLMRSSLSALEIELGPRGFLRTHRSWLVNASRMTALKRQGSGDYTVELESLEAPLSRRFPKALAKLRRE
jgi:DNA-binding LytR/AlgR family response regulator